MGHLYTVLLNSSRPLVIITRTTPSVLVGWVLTTTFVTRTASVENIVRAFRACVRIAEASHAVHWYIILLVTRRLIIASTGRPSS